MSKLLDVLKDKNRDELHSAFFNYIREATKKNAIPYLGAFELTPRCNLDCKMCYIHLLPDQMKSPELTTDQWLRLINDAYEMGMGEAVLTGGECLLHPGFREIYDALYQKGVFIHLLSNGTMLDKDNVTWLAKKPPTSVQISVYGDSPETYRIMTGSANAFLKVDQALTLLRGAGIRFTTSTTVTKTMMPFVEDIYHYCKSKKPLSVKMSTYVFSSRDNTNRDVAQYVMSPAEQVDVLKLIAKMDGCNIQSFTCEEDLFHENESSSPNMADLCTYSKGVKCGAGKNGFSISWNGRMKPCLIFESIQAFPLVDGFQAAWANINRKVMEYLPPRECVSCQYRQVCRTCVFEHYLDVGKEGRASPKICELAKRMAIEGITNVR